MKRKTLPVIFLSAVMLMLAVFPQTAEASSSAPARVRVDGLLYTGQPSPVIIDGTAYMHSDYLMKLVGATYSWWNEAEQQFSFVVGGKTALVKVGSADAKYGNDIVKISPPRLIDGKLMLPLKWVCGLASFQVAWDSMVSVVDVMTGKAMYSPLESRIRETAEGAIKLSFAEAYKKALAANSTLANMKKPLEDMEDSVSDARDAFANKYLLTNENPTTSSYDWAVDRRNLFAVEQQYSAMLYNKKLTEDGIMLQLMNSLTTLYKTENQIYSLENNIALSEINIKNIELKLSLGMESASKLETEKYALTQSKINLDNLKTSIENTKLDISKLLGYKASDKLEISYVPSTDTTFSEPYSYFESQKKIAPNVLLKEQAYDKEVYAQETYLALDDDVQRQHEDEKDQLEDSVAKEKRIFQDYLNSFEKQIHSTYGSLRQLEETYASLKIDYETARLNYEKAVVSCLLGQSTTYQADQLKLALMSAELKMSENRYDFALARFTYVNPHLLQ